MATIQNQIKYLETIIRLCWRDYRSSSYPPVHHNKQEIRDHLRDTIQELRRIRKHDN